MVCIRCGGADALGFVSSTDILYGTTSARFDIVRCAACGMARLKDPPEDLSAFYPSTYWFDGQVSRWAERYRKVVARDHVGFLYRAWQGGVALDVGCGGGLLYGMLRKRGVPAFGLDNSEIAASLAWGRNGLPVVAGDFTHAPFAPASVGLISMFHVLEHLRDPASFLRAAFGLLAPGGALVVQVPNLDSWQARAFGARWNGLDVPRHLWNFRAEDLRALVVGAGFVVVREKQFSLRDNPAGLATTLVPSLDPMARWIRGKRTGIAHSAAYLGLVLASLPFALLEAAFGHGSSIMLEARKF